MRGSLGMGQEKACNEGLCCRSSVICALIESTFCEVAHGTGRVARILPVCDASGVSESSDRLAPLDPARCHIVYFLSCQLSPMSSVSICLRYSLRTILRRHDGFFLVVKTPLGTSTLDVLAMNERDSKFHRRRNVSTRSGGVLGLLTLQG